MQTQLSHLGRAALAKGPGQLRAQGYTVLREIVPPKVIDQVSLELAPHFDATPFCRGGFYGERTKRFGRLLVRSTQMSELVLNPAVLGIAEAVLGPWCDTLQLNLTQAIEIHPGALAQFPHRDQDMWGGVTGSVEYLVNILWPLTPFSRDNGATLIWPGSHGAAVHDPQASDPPVIAECRPGDAIIFLGSTLHGAGANISALPRRALIISYCLGWLKPYENQWLAYPPAIARHFHPELAALVGYRQHRPNLGNFEGQCPSILLQGAVPEHIAAVDALRPDQERQLNAFVAEQRQEGVGRVP